MAVGEPAVKIFQGVVFGDVLKIVGGAGPKCFITFSQGVIPWIFYGLGCHGIHHPKTTIWDDMFFTLIIFCQGGVHSKNSSSDCWGDFFEKSNLSGLVWQGEGPTILGGSSQLRSG